MAEAIRNNKSSRIMPLTVEVVSRWLESCPTHTLDCPSPDTGKEIQSETKTGSLNSKNQNNNQHGSLLEVLM